MVTSQKIDFETFSGSTTQWRSWTPTLTNFTGTVNVARYTLVGKTCYFYIKVTQGPTVSGRHTFSLPLPAAASWVDTGGWGGPIAIGDILDAGTAIYNGAGGIMTSTTCALMYPHVSGGLIDYLPSSPSAPMVWVSGSDWFRLYGSYETA